MWNNYTLWTASYNTIGYKVYYEFCVKNIFCLVLFVCLSVWIIIIYSFNLLYITIYYTLTVIIYLQARPSTTVSYITYKLNIIFKVQC